MGIGSWLGLWFGLSIPAILLMYILKRKFVDTRVPSHLLWNRVLRNIEANRPWQKLQNRWLLWLQLLAAALLVFTLMQPYWWVSGGSKGHVLIVADTSGSMSADSGQAVQSGEGHSSRLELLEDKIMQYIDKEARGSEITLLSISAEPNVVISREKDRNRLKEAIRGLKPFYGKAAYQETLSLASALTKEDKDAEVVVFTDEQWKGQTDTISFQVPTRIVHIGEGTVFNASIQQFGIQQGERTNEAVAVISGTSSNNSPLEVNLYGDGKLLKTSSVTLPKTGAFTLKFRSLEKAEVYRLQLDQADAYLADNESFAFGQTQETNRVLLFTPGNIFLEKALQLTGAEVTKISTDGKKDVDIKNKDVSTDDSPSLPDLAPDLIVMDGPAPAFTQENSWKQLIQKTALWTIGGSGKEIEVGGESAKPELHPVTSYLKLSGLYFGQVLNSKAPAWGKAIVNVGSFPAVYAGQDNGVPRLSFQFELKNTDLPLSAEFPIMVNNAVTWLSSGKGSGLGRVTAGNRMEIPILPDTVKARWVAKDGLAQRNNVEDIPAEQGKQGILSLQLVPDVPGLFAFEQENNKGEKVSSYVESTVDPFEGKLSQTSKLVLTSLDTTNVTSSTKQNTEAKDAQRTPISLMWLTALLVLLVVLAEWGVYQRGRSI
ncbi:vWA domain-containing protein [Paenibacillus pini]|uniref:VWFA domain-containing protein n=1 Tax=Paenibacillus pini JCM 16418 TaxID=1236976 RepID=W7Z8K8_9BACL|nr:VWA domain-containing protein [Paenibacillus pini]GAF10774.1 hypothetical protein JCM16418_4994 [Paenibacillus pini JCM 16418]